MHNLGKSNARPGGTLVEPPVRRVEPAGFTLIELLVVISIIALLISILLPALQSAKRQVRVLRCMSNFKQLGIGLKVYTTENNDKYPPPPIGANWDGPIYDTNYGDPGMPDGRINFMEIAGGRPADLLWCPLNANKGPNYDGVDEWTRHYQVCRDGCYQPGGISIYFLIPTDWDWTNSGNPDLDGDGTPDRPDEPDHSEAAIMSDHSWWWPSQCTGDGVQTVCWSVHTSQLWPPGSSQRVIDTNILYGDGHVITRNRIENWINRNDGNLTMW